MTATNQNFYLRVWEYFALALGKCEWDIGIMSTPDDQRRQVERTQRNGQLTRGIIDFARVAIKV